MTPPTCSVRSPRRPLVFVLFVLVAAVCGPAAQADPLYTITDLGTLPGYTSSTATGLNNQGQVVGQASNANGSSASFLYSNGQLTQINPMGGSAAQAINDSGQVVGYPITSINDSGQTVSPFSPVTSSGQVVSLLPEGVAPAGTLVPYAINNAGDMAGYTVVQANGYALGIGQPAILENGQITNLSTQLGLGASAQGNAYAINQQGDVLFQAAPGSSPESVEWYLYHASTGQATLINFPAGQGVPVALNSEDQIVGAGLLYSNGTVQTLLSLLPQNSGWTNLNASAINDEGQIVGSGTYNGQTVAFLMTPNGVEAPEPATITLWGGIATLIVMSQGRRAKRRPVTELLP